MPLLRSKGKTKRKTKLWIKRRRERRLGSEPEVPTEKPTLIGDAQHVKCASFSESRY
jgi:hypothetical protein